MVAYQVPGLGLGKVLIKHAIQSACFIDVSGHTILNALRRISCKVVCLALHGANACILEEEPVVHLVVFAGALGERNLVLWVILVRQVLQDTTRLEQADFLTIGELVGQSGNPAIGVDLKEPAMYQLVSDETTGVETHTPPFVRWRPCRSS